MKLKIDRDILLMAFEEDEYGEYEHRYLDLETGRVIWVEPEGAISGEATEKAEFYDSRPDRYLAIPYYRHADYHGLAMKFADSEAVAPEHREWLFNSQERYFCVDITDDGTAIMGGMGVFVAEAERLGYDYRAWQDEQIEQTMMAWLHRHGIEPEWL